MNSEYSAGNAKSGGSIVVVTAIIAIVSCCGCNSNSSSHLKLMKEDFRHFPRDLWRDSKEYVSRMDNLAILLAAGGASAYVRCAHDDEIEDHFSGRHTFGRDFTIALGTIPIAELSLTGAGYILGTLGEDEKLRRVAHSMIEAQALNAIYTQLLKFAAQDLGPNGERYGWPSGHTSTSVTFAAVMNEYYGPWVGVPLYALSGFVMYERMETREHVASDIVFGAAIGYTVGRTIAGGHKPEIFGMKVLPYVNPESGSAGIMLAKRF